MQYVSTFGAFAPADSPKVIMLVCVDEPDYLTTGTSFYGSAVAAPVVSAVFKEGLEQLEIYPQYTADEQAAQDTIVPFIIGKSVIDATTKLNTEGLDSTFIGSGSTVVRTVPDTGQLISRSGKVVVYMDGEEENTSVVPSVIGMSVSDANKTLGNAGFNIRLAGGGISNAKAKAVSQSIDAGTSIRQGTVVEVSFVIDDETW